MNGNVRIPPDGVGKRIQTMVNTIDGQETQTQVVAIAGANDPTHGQYIDNQGSAYIRFGEGQPALDPYARMKVVETEIVGVYEFSHDGYDDLFYTREENGGTYTYNPQTAAVILEADSTINAFVGRQTNRYHYYQVGTGLFAAFTISCGDTGKANNTRSWGLYDDECGIFFGLCNDDEDQLAVTIRSSSTGSVIDTTIHQGDWNYDKLDGTGLSGYTLNVTSAIRYWINISYPGGSIKFGIFNGAQRIKCHEISNTNGLSYPKIKTVNLPVTFENYNTGLTSGTSTLNCFSAVVLSEGSTDYTFWRYGGLESNNITVTTNTPVLTVKSKALLPTGEKNNIQAYPETLSVYVSGGPVKIDKYWISSTDVLTGATFLVDNDSTLIADSAATAIDLTDQWISSTRYFEPGVENINLSPYYELNDEGICTGGYGTEGATLCYVATKLNPADTVTVSLALSIRELW